MSALINSLARSFNTRVARLCIFLNTPVGEFLAQIKVSVRITLRGLFGRTPPQTEMDWQPLSEGLPPSDPNNRHASVEFYSVKDDHLSLVYVWSLSAYSGEECKNYFWRTPHPSDRPDRGFAYYLRSQTVLG